MLRLLISGARFLPSSPAPLFREKELDDIDEDLDFDEDDMEDYGIGQSTGGPDPSPPSTPPPNDDGNRSDVDDDLLGL